MNEAVARYYSQRVRRYGATPLGVDWTCAPTQQLRFVQLLKVVGGATPFSVHDLGCGWGALLDFMRTRWRAADFSYLGTDISQPMIEAAIARGTRRRARFEVTSQPLAQADYTLASGIFNVKLDASRSAWERAIARTLADMAASSRRGFAVNFIESMRGVPAPAQLYRATPQRWVRHCRDELGFDVEIVQGYGLREFTLCATRR